MTIEELMARHVDLSREAEMLGSVWLEAHAKGDSDTKDQAEAVLSANNRDRLKVERKLRKKYGVRL